MLYELKMVTSFFVKSAEQSELYSCPIERRLTLLRFGYVWACAADGDNAEGVKWLESVGWVTVFFGEVDSGASGCRL